MTEKTAPKKKAPAKKATKSPAKKAAKKTTAPKKKAATTKAAVKEAAPKATKKAPAQIKHYEDDSVRVELALDPGCKCQLTATLAPKEIESAHQQATKEVSKSVSLPGFRKGKVPKSLIEKNYSGSIKEQQMQILLQNALDLALKLADIRPLNYRNIQPKVEKNTESEVTFSYEFEMYPQVPTLNLSNIQLKKVDQEEVTDAKVDEVIDVMRSYRAKWTPVEDRAIELGDYVDLDITDLDNDTKLVEQKRVQVEKGKLSKWLMEVLVGMKKDEEKEGVSKWDADVPTTPKEEFKSTKCKVKVLGVYRGELPPVDDAFAKAMGTESAAELRTQVVLRLNQNAKAEQEQKETEQLDQKLVELVNFELPQSLIEAEIETKTRLKTQQKQDSKAKLSDEESQEVEKDSINALKLFFILQKIAHDNNIIVSENELREVLAERISKLNLPKQLQSDPKYKNRLIQEMRMNTFIDLLTDKVKKHLLKQVSFA